MEALIQVLRQLQASAFIYYTKAHGYHWNVEGILFDQFHEFFSEIYNDAWASVDDYAEWIRIFSQFAEFNVQNVLAASSVKYDLDMNVNNPITMLKSLQASNDQIVSDLKNAINVASGANEQAVGNFFQDRLSAHEKFRWKISASLKTMMAN
ncbi:DNA starvation/stationary phase protection protein [bacterium]|nr:DNA starvation/stationary phase protection protein [bacterium]